MFQFDLFSIQKTDDGFWVSLFNIDNFGSFDRSLLAVGKKGDTWFVEMGYLRLTPIE